MKLPTTKAEQRDLAREVSDVINEKGYEFSGRIEDVELVIKLVVEKLQGGEAK